MSDHREISRVIKT